MKKKMSQLINMIFGHEYNNTISSKKYQETLTLRALDFCNISMIGKNKEKGSLMSVPSQFSYKLFRIETYIH